MKMIDDLCSEIAGEYPRLRAIEKCRLILLESNPEGINQYSGLGSHASSMTEKALTASAATSKKHLGSPRLNSKWASDAFASGDIAAAAKQHKQAAESHSHTAGQHMYSKKPEDIAAKAAHEDAAKAHDAAYKTLVPSESSEDGIAHGVTTLHAVRTNTREGVSQDHLFPTREAAETFASSRNLPHSNITTRQVMPVDRNN